MILIGSVIGIFSFCGIIAYSAHSESKHKEQFVKPLQYILKSKDHETK